MAGLRIGVLGGTFDPIHTGHLVFAEQAREQAHLDAVKFVPAGDPWRKADRAVTDAQHRLAMTRLAVVGNPGFAVDDREVQRAGPTFTVDTLRELRAEMGPEDELFFLVGEDALADMPRWREPRGIVETAHLIIAPRAGVDGKQEAASAGETFIRLDMPYVGISSTWLRERTAGGHGLRYMVPDAVADYIERNGLYVN